MAQWLQAGRGDAALGSAVRPEVGNRNFGGAALGGFFQRLYLNTAMGVGLSYLIFPESVSNPVTGYSDARALEAGSMLHYALALQEINGDYYYSPKLYNALFRAFEVKRS